MDMYYVGIYNNVIYVQVHSTCIYRYTYIYWSWNWLCFGAVGLRAAWRRVEFVYVLYYRGPLWYLTLASSMSLLMMDSEM